MGSGEEEDMAAGAGGSGEAGDLAALEGAGTEGVEGVRAEGVRVAEKGEGEVVAGAAEEAATL